MDNINNVTWYGGVSLKRTMESLGLEPTVAQWLVAAHLIAEEQGVSVAEMSKLLKEISKYDPVTHSDQAKIIKELGY